MAYQTMREKITSYFEEKIIPSLMKEYWKTLDYNKTILIVQRETGASENMVADVLGILIRTGKLIEERNLALPSKTVDVLREEDNKEKQKREKEAEEILNKNIAEEVK